MSTISHRANKRRRRKPPQAYTQLSAAEERFFLQAMRNSKVDTRRPGTLDVPYAPTFFPTIQDMEGNPLDYVEKIRSEAEQYGICKICPPKEWNPPFCKSMLEIFYGYQLRTTCSYCLQSIRAMHVLVRRTFPEFVVLLIEVLPLPRFASSNKWAKSLEFACRCCSFPYGSTIRAGLEYQRVVALYRNIEANDCNHG